MKKTILSFLLLISMLLCACATGSSTDTQGEASGNAAETDKETEAQTEAVKQIYCVRTPFEPNEKSLAQESYENIENLDEAKKKANDPLLAAKGYAVYDSEGNYVYSKYGEFTACFLAESKHIADYIKKEGYTYGSAAKNPAITYHKRIEGDRRSTEKIVSCDRFVGWALYDVGYTDQPEDGGMYVYGNSNNRAHHLGLFLEKEGWTRIEDENDIQAGDIVFVREAWANGEMYGAHVFICAGTTGRRGTYYRYDCGSNERVNCIGPYAADYGTDGQPFSEGIDKYVYSYRYNPDKDVTFKAWLADKTASAK